MKEWKSVMALFIEGKGGDGSGNFGHAGRPGEVGGAAPGGGESSDSGIIKDRLGTDKDGTRQQRDLVMAKMSKAVKGEVVSLAKDNGSRTGCSIVTDLKKKSCEEVFRQNGFKKNGEIFIKGNWQVQCSNTSRLAREHKATEVAVLWER